MTDRGKIKPRRGAGACTQHQPDIANAIKRARESSERGKPIKVAGSHEVEISIYREIKASIVVLVGVEEQAEETVEAEEVAAAE